MEAQRLEEGLVAGVSAALAPYPWRELTPSLVARLVLAAADRVVLEESLRRVPGADVGRWDGLRPVPPDDLRAAPLLAFLQQHPRHGLTLPGLCRHLLRTASGA